MKSARMWVAAVVAMMSVGCAANAVSSEDEGSASVSEGALNPTCALVKCAMPLCGEGQQLSYQGGCCPRCVGRPSRCATVMCAAVACPEGQQLVTSPGDCCGHCIGKPAVAECNTAADCPVYTCIRCPCPVSECVGNKCVTTTPDESTCSGAL
ncbi:MAG: hypothetical protein HYV09_16740 [Deltaproteobacteria bacterium]|nr:hypothetical protein [Deltaproteobacteria bacterium]